MIKEPLMVINVVVISLVIHTVSGIVSAESCIDGQEYWTKEGKCVPCTDCNINSLVVRTPCYLYQDTECATLDEVLSWSQIPPDSKRKGNRKNKKKRIDKQNNRNLKKESRRQSFNKIKDWKKDPCRKDGLDINHKKKKRGRLKCKVQKNNTGKKKNRNKVKKPVFTEVTHSTLPSIPLNPIKTHTFVNKTITKNEKNDTHFFDVMPSHNKPDKKIYFHILLSAIFAVICSFTLLVTYAIYHFYTKWKKQRLKKEKHENDDLAANGGLATLLPDVTQVSSSPRDANTSREAEINSEQFPRTEQVQNFQTLPHNRSTRNQLDFNRTNTLPRNLSCVIPSHASRNSNEMPRVLRRPDSPSPDSLIASEENLTNDIAQLSVPNSFTNSSEVGSNIPIPFMDRLLEQRRVVGFTNSVENNLYVEMWKGPPTPQLLQRSNQISESISIPRNQRFVAPSQSPIVMRTFRRPNNPVNQTGNQQNKF